MVILTQGSIIHIYLYITIFYLFKTKWHIIDKFTFLSVYYILSLYNIRETYFQITWNRSIKLSISTFSKTL